MPLSLSIFLIPEYYFPYISVSHLSLSNISHTSVNLSSHLTLTSVHLSIPLTPFKMDYDSWDCPLCMEEMDEADKRFHPCSCGYQICRFCWHKIRQDMNKLCPACRKEYTEEGVEVIPSSSSSNSNPSSPSGTGGLSRSSSTTGGSSGFIDVASAVARKRSSALANASGSAGQSLSSSSPSSGNNYYLSRDPQHVVSSRRHLSELRVIQKNLVYVIGLSPKIANEDILGQHEYFGQYGRVVKIVVNKRNYVGASSGHLPSASVYVTYGKKEDAARAIHCIDGSVFDGRVLRASYGTTKIYNTITSSILMYRYYFVL